MVGSRRPLREENTMPTDGDPPDFPFPVPDPCQPPGQYAELRATAPVAPVRLPTGHVAWLVTRYEDVRSLLADTRFSRAATTEPGAPRLLPIARGSKSLFVMDPPEHTRLRRLISRAFAPRQIERLRPRIAGLTASLLDDMTSGGRPADLVGELARPLPITVICEMLGVPYGDVPRFREWTDAMLSFGTEATETVSAAREGLGGYLSDLIGAKRRSPGDDLLTALVEARDEGDRLSQEELIAFGYTLLGAGYHATSAEIVHAVLSLCRDPELARALRDDPDLITTAVEELLRHSQAGGGLGTLRIALEDVTIGDTKIRAGQAVLPSINSANRDEEIFDGAAGIDLGRRPNPHLAFGYGIHHCVGAQLGRIELATVVESLVRRLPGLRLAVPEDTLDWTAGVAFRLPHKLPVTW